MKNVAYACWFQIVLRVRTTSIMCHPYCKVQSMQPLRNNSHLTPIHEAVSTSFAQGLQWCMNFEQVDNAACSPRPGGMHSRGLGWGVLAVRAKPLTSFILESKFDSLAACLDMNL